MKNQPSAKQNTRNSDKNRWTTNEKNEKKSDQKQPCRNETGNKKVDTQDKTALKTHIHIWKTILE